MSTSDVSSTGEPVDPIAAAQPSEAAAANPQLALDPVTPPPLVPNDAMTTATPPEPVEEAAADASPPPNSFDAVEATAVANKAQLEDASIVGAGNMDTAPGEANAAQPVPGVPPESVPAGEDVPDELPPVPPAEESSEGLGPAEQGVAGMPPEGVDPGATLGSVGAPAVPPADVDTAPVSAPAAFATAGVPDTDPAATNVDPTIAEPGGVDPPVVGANLADVAKKAELPPEAIAQTYAISNAEVAAGDLHAQNAEFLKTQRENAPANRSSTTAVPAPITTSPANDEKAEPPMSESETEPTESEKDPKGTALSLLSEAATAIHGAIDSIFEKGNTEIEPLGEELRVGAETLVTQLGGSSPELKPFTNIIIGASDPLMKNVEVQFDAKAHAGLALFQARIEALPFFK